MLSYNGHKNHWDYVFPGYIPVYPCISCIYPCIFQTLNWIKGLPASENLFSHCQHFNVSEKRQNDEKGKGEVWSLVKAVSKRDFFALAATSASCISTYCFFWCHSSDVSWWLSHLSLVSCLACFLLLIRSHQPKLAVVWQAASSVWCGW